MTDDWDISHDIDDLIEPENKRKNIFAKTHSEITTPTIIEVPSYVEDHTYIYPKITDTRNREFVEDYDRLHKGKEMHIEFMTPDEYLKIANPSNTVHSKDKLKAYLADAEAGAKFPMPFLEYVDGKYKSQEGIHRTIVSKKMGIEKIPVKIIHKDYNKYANETQWFQRMTELSERGKKQNPFTFENELI